MTPTNHIQNPYETSGVSPPEQALSESTPTNENSADDAAQARKHNYVREGFQNRTRGEKKFNITTYFGMGYVGVWAFSLFASWALRDSKFFSPTYERGVQGLTRGLASITGKEVEAVAPAVRKYANISSLFAGGTVVSVLPIKYREDHKYEIVKKYDEEIYGKEAVENDPTIKAAHEDIKHAPKQTWSSVFASRLTSFIVTYASAQLIGNGIEKHSTRFGRAVNRKLTSNPETLAQIARAEAAPGQKYALGATPGDPNADTITTRIGHDAAADGMYTVLTSGALYIFTRIFAPLFDQRYKFEQEHAKTDTVNAAALPQPVPQPAAPLVPHEEPGIPRAQVSAVEAQARVAAPTAELAQGA